MKREIDKIPQVLNISKDIIELLSRLCFREDDISKSDLIFCFGTNIVPKSLVKNLEHVLLKEYSKEVIITGGIANYSDKEFINIPESEIIYQLIDINRFKDVQFHIERSSKNNIENVNNASKIINFTKFKSIICISHSYASARSLQTLRNVFSGRIQSFPYNIPSNRKDILIEKTNWWETELGKSLVWGEFLRLKKYGFRGDFNLTEEMKIIIHNIDFLIQNIKK